MKKFKNTLEVTDKLTTYQNKLIDAYVNRQMVLKSSGNILPIHDSFQIHPNYCDEAINNYKAILNAISSDTQFLQRMLSNIAGKSICDPFKDKEPIVVTSDYCIC